MKETSGWKVSGRGPDSLWRLDPGPNVTRGIDSHPGLLPWRAHAKQAVGDLSPSGTFSPATRYLSPFSVIRQELAREGGLLNRAIRVAADGHGTKIVLAGITASEHRKALRWWAITLEFEFDP